MSMSGEQGFTSIKFLTFEPEARNQFHAIYMNPRRDILIREEENQRPPFHKFSLNKCEYVLIEK